MLDDFRFVEEGARGRKKLLETNKGRESEMWKWKMK